MYCPKTFTYDDAVGKEDDEEVKPGEVDENDERTNAMYVAAKMKEFADEIAVDVDDDDADTDKINMENDKEDEGGVDVI